VLSACKKNFGACFCNSVTAVDAIGCLAALLSLSEITYCLESDVKPYLLTLVLDTV